MKKKVNQSFQHGSMLEIEIELDQTLKRKKVNLREKWRREKSGYWLR